MDGIEKYWDKLKKIVNAHPKGKPLDKEGRFYPDPTPVAPPVGQSHVADIDMFEVMRQRIRNEGTILSQMQGDETFEEADDFEIDDDPEPFSPYEEIIEQARPDQRGVNGEKTTAPANDNPTGAYPEGDNRSPTAPDSQAKPDASAVPSLKPGSAPGGG